MRFINFGIETMGPVTRVHLDHGGREYAVEFPNAEHRRGAVIEFREYMHAEGFKEVKVPRGKLRDALIAAAVKHLFR